MSSMLFYVTINPNYTATVRGFDQLEAYLKENQDQIGKGFGKVEPASQNCTDEQYWKIVNICEEAGIARLLAESKAAEEETNYPEFKSIDVLEAVCTMLNSRKTEFNKVYGFFWGLYLNYHVKNTDTTVSAAVREAAMNCDKAFVLAFTPKCVKPKRIFIDAARKIEDFLAVVAEHYEFRTGLSGCRVILDLVYGNPFYTPSTLVDIFGSPLGVVYKDDPGVVWGVKSLKFDDKDGYVWMMTANSGATVSGTFAAHGEFEFVLMT